MTTQAYINLDIEIMGNPDDFNINYINMTEKALDELKIYIKKHVLENYEKLREKLTDILVRKYFKPLPFIIQNEYENLLYTLNEKERKILKLCFGLNNKPLNGEEIADLTDQSKENVRLIKQKAILKLSRMHAGRLKILRNKYLEYLINPINDRVLRNDLLICQIRDIINEKIKSPVKKSLLNLLEKYEITTHGDDTNAKNFFCDFFGEINSYLYMLEKDVCRRSIQNQIIAERLEQNVNDFDFSTRSKNIFRENNIKSLADIITKGESGLMELSKFGKGSLDQTNEIMKELGFSFSMNVKKYLEGIEDD